MDERRSHDRRTGAALLALVAATNVVPWMELLLGGTATAELRAPSEMRVALGTCLLAVLLLLVAWFSGRRGRLPESPRISRPRTIGTRLAAIAAGANVALAGAIMLLARHRYGLAAELPLFAGVWYLLILPVEIIAAFALGRTGQDPGRRLEAVPPQSNRI